VSGLDWKPRVQVGTAQGRQLSSVDPSRILWWMVLAAPRKGGVRRMLNNRLRTGTDKGNLTV
jgi:hypothetical protein